MGGTESKSKVASLDGFGQTLTGYKVDRHKGTDFKVGFAHSAMEKIPEVPSKTICSRNSKKALVPRGLKEV